MATTYDIITILGTTASGKTSLATQLAFFAQGEVVSADSRQVYQGMNIGTGKDLKEYTVEGVPIPYHLIDICRAGEKYNLFEFQKDCHQAIEDITRRSKLPILCGGTGMYIEAILKGYHLPDVPENPALRRELQSKTPQELASMLASYGPMHNTTDLDTVQRTIRAIEIAEYSKQHEVKNTHYTPPKSLTIGIEIARDVRRKRISDRLKQRIQEGMIEEVQALLSGGLTPKELIYYGLEYKFITLYLMGELSYEQMYSQLEIAIHQFAKRQQTWFRGMVKRGTSIRWLPFDMPVNEKIEQALHWWNAN